MASFGMDLSRILQSCDFAKVYISVIPTVIGLFSGLLFSMFVVGRRYMSVAPLSATPESLSLFSIFCGGDR